MKTRNDELRQQWWLFHKQHPEVYAAFKQYTFELINSGRSHGAAKMVVERMRWESHVNSQYGNDFKVNNNYTSNYARLFMHDHPQYDGFFRTRALISKEAPATELPPLMPRDFT